MKSTRLTLGRTMLYSSASAGLNILSITVSTWILYFYAPPPDSGRPQYLPVALIGILLTIVSLWDAVIDPFIGHMSDNLRSRLGRRRPFLLFGAPVASILMVLIWTPPASSTLVNAVYFVVIVGLHFTAFSLVGIPYDATLPEMVPDSRDRVGLSYWKYVFGLAGVLVGSLVAAPLFSTIGPVAMGLVVGVVSMITIWVSLLGLRETPRTVPSEPLAVMEGLRATFRNSQFVIVFISTLFVHVAYQMLLANLPYFVKLVVGQTEGVVAIFQGVMILVMGITGPLWSVWNRKLSQPKLLNIAMLGLAAAIALGFFVGSMPGIPLMAQGLAVIALIGVMLGGYFIVIYAMMGNVVDYDEMLTGRRREAIYYGTFSFALGLGIAVGTLVLPLLLQLGYTSANPMGVRLAFPVMALFMLAGFVVFQGYRLGDTPEETRQKLHIKEAASD